MIKEIDINGFNTELKNTKLDYPQSSNGNAFKLFFNYLGVASRGGSKTYTTCQIIKDYEDNVMKSSQGTHKIRTILISPTIDANSSMLNNLKSLSPNDMYSEYKEDTLKDIIDDIKSIIDEVDEYKEYEKAYYVVDNTPKSKIKDLLKISPELFDVLEKYNFEPPKVVAENFRYIEKPITFLVIDDCMGSSAFNRKSQSLLLYWLIKNRHIFTSFFLLVQSMKSVPKNIRLNCNVYFLGKFASKKMILNDLYDEVSNILTPEEFEMIYDHAIKASKYGALIIDNSGDTKRFYRNLEKEIILEK